MKFEALSVGAFGKLSQREFHFSQGINLIYGKNETGKSTLAAYLKFMLYGFPAKGGRTVAANDKLHYMPWDGGAATGAAEIALSDGRHIRLQRSCGAKNSCRMTELPSGKELRPGKSPGEEFLGVDEAAFARMAYIRQNDVSADHWEEVSQSVQNIVFAADESVNIERAQKKLKEYRNAYRNRSRNTGRCYELEERIRQLRYDFDKASETHKTLLAAESRLLELRRTIKQNEDKTALLEKELENIEAFEAKKLLDAVLDSKYRLEEARKTLEQAKEAITREGRLLDAKALEEVMAAVQRARLAEEGLRETETALDKVIEARQEAENADETLSRFASLERTPEELSRCAEELSHGVRRRGIFAAGCLGAAVLTGVLFSLKLFPELALYLSLAGGGFALLFLLAFGLFMGKRRKLKELLQETGFDSAGELCRCAEAYPAARERIQELASKETLLRETCEEKERLSHEAQRQLREALAACGEQDGAPEAFLESMKEKLAVFSEKQNEYSRRESAYDAYLATCDMHALSERVQKYKEEPKRDKKTVMRELDYCQKAQAALAEKEKEYIRAAAAPASTVRKPSEILAERSACEAQLKAAEGQAEALELAMSALEQACEEMRCGVSPRIAERAGTLYRSFTGNDGEGLTLTPEFELGTVRQGMQREQGFLSAGTADAAYLAVRIALCESLFREPPVLILDECFAHMDEERMENTLRVLSSLSGSFQMLLFTCHKREIDAVRRIAGAQVIEL